MSKIYLFKYVIDGEIYYYGYKNDSFTGIVRSTDELSIGVTHLLYEKNLSSDNVQIVNNHVIHIYDLIGKMLYDMVSNDLSEKCDIYSYQILSETANFSHHEICLAVRHNDFMITNSHEQKYFIKGLMSTLLYSVNELGRVYLFNVKGIRTKLTYSDKNLQYKHSHLRSGLSEAYYCLGLSDLKTRTQNSTSLSDLDILYDISILESFVKWESIEGGPYYKMKDLFSLNSSIRNMKKIELTKDLMEKIRIRTVFERGTRMFRSKVEMDTINDVPIDISTDTDDFYAFKMNDSYCVKRKYLNDYLSVKRTKFNISQTYYFRGSRQIETEEFTKEEIDEMVNSFFKRQPLNMDSIQLTIDNIINNDIYRPTIAEETAI